MSENVNEIFEQMNGAIDFLKGYLDIELYSKKCVDAHSLAIRALRKLQYPSTEDIPIEDFDHSERNHHIKYTLEIVFSKEKFLSMLEDMSSYKVDFPDGVSAKIHIFSKDSSSATFGSKELNFVSSLIFGIGDFYSPWGVQYWFEYDTNIYELVFRVDEDCVEKETIFCFARFI